MNMGTGWKTYTGLVLAGLAFGLGQFGVVTPQFTDWGEMIGALFAAFGLRQRLG